VRSIVGLLPLAATTFFEPSAGDRAPEAAAKIEWLLRNRPEMTRSIHPFGRPGHGGRFLLSVLDGERLRRVLQVTLDEREFLSPRGIRSLSRRHAEEPYVLGPGMGDAAAGLRLRPRQAPVRPPRRRRPRAVRDHLRADLGHQGGLARFLENHDEPRAAGTFPWERHQAAAVLTFLAPVLRFFHPGQFEGRTRHVPVHFDRAPAEPADPAVRAFYERLLEVLRDPLPRGGDWRLLEPREAWSGNPSHDGFGPRRGNATCRCPVSPSWGRRSTSPTGLVPLGTSARPTT
jgi:hypothetical protein